jgi:hypothetical protein
MSLMGLGLAMAGVFTAPGYGAMPQLSHRPAYSRGPSGVRRVKREALKRRNRLRAKGRQ